MNKLSITKNRYFPKFFQEQAPRLIDFMGYYLEWMDDKQNPYWTFDHLIDVTNIDSSVDDYTSHLKNELMKDFPIDYVGNLKYIMRNLVLLYQSKGTVESLQFFFRAAYNSFCKIEYPKEFILKTSDGIWNQGYYLYTSDIPENELTDYQNKSIKGMTSNVIGVINDVVPHYFENDQTLYYCFNIIDNIKSFNSDETIKILDTDPVVTFAITKSEYSKGYWTGTTGFLDSDMKIQDSYYYQNFSYEITSSVSLSEYQEIVNLLFNPVGMKMFGKVQLYGALTEYSKELNTMIHWWILHIFMGIYAMTKSISYNVKIKKYDYGYSSYFSPDSQLYYKLYGSVDRYKDLTPTELMTWTNESSKLIFNSEGLLLNTANWYDELLDNNEYYILNIEAKMFKRNTSINNGNIVVPSYLKNLAPMVFIDGKKIIESNIQSTNDGYTISSGNTSSNVILYFPKSHTVKYSVQTKLANDIIVIDNWTDNKAVFLNGKLINSYIKNDKIILPENGIIEIFLYEQYDYLKCNKYIKNSNKIIMNNPLKIKYM